MKIGRTSGAHQIGLVGHSKGRDGLSEPSGSVGSITDWRSNNPHPCQHPAFPREGDAYGMIVPHPFPDGLESHPCRRQTKGRDGLSEPSGSVGSITDWRSNNPHPCLHPAFPREGDAYGMILPHPFADGLESHPCRRQPKGRDGLSEPSGSVGSITDWRSNNPHPCLHPAFPREGDTYGMDPAAPFSGRLGKPSLPAETENPDQSMSGVIR